MKTFTINDRYSIACEWKKTRVAFKHEAVLLDNGNEVDRAKICYQNRTWERFEYESVISKLLYGARILDDNGIRAFLDLAAGADHEEVRARFGTIAMIAQLGELMAGPDLSARNDWSRRMLATGLEPQGLIFPDDWATLSEEDKKTRLDGVIEILKQPAA